MRSVPILQHEIEFLKKYLKPKESFAKIFGRIIAICGAIFSLLLITYIVTQFGMLAFKNSFPSEDEDIFQDFDIEIIPVEELIGSILKQNKTSVEVIEPPKTEIDEPKSTTTPESTSKKPTKITPTGAYEPEYLIKTKGCRIPDMNPFDPTTWLYYRSARPIQCKAGAPLPLIESDNHGIFVNKKARKYYYNDTDQVDCCWRTFWRSLIRDNHVIYSKKCTPFDESVTLNQEFVKVECHLPNKTMYEDFFTFVRLKASVERRCVGLDSSEVDSDDRKLSVLVIGMNSVSRLNLHRAMPRTVEALKKMGAIEMLGYNKVGFDMYDNLVPFLTGLSQRKFEKFCWPNHNKPFDKCPFLWKDFAVKGYRTIFAEDNCNTSMFNHYKPGFRLQPTDYYLRPLCVAAEPKIGNAEKCNTYLCQGARKTYDRLLNYTFNVAAKFFEKPYFGVFWQSSLTHDFIEDAQLSDESYYNLLKNLVDSDLLENTVLIFMSDHGTRFGSFRQSYQGRMEENLPFAFIRLPKWWTQNYKDTWKSLYKNAKKLTTPYDLHETLRDVLDPKRLQPERNEIDDNQIENNEIEADRKIAKQAKNYPGSSLFKPISEERTCKDAGIPDHWCTCHHQHEVSRDDTKVKNMSQAIVKKINKLISKEPKCAKLKISSVIDIKTVNDANYERGLIMEEWNTLDSSEEKMQWSEYSLTIKTTPGDGIFEALVRHHPDNTVEVVSPVSRFNSYAEHSSCAEFDLRFYCHCINDMK